VALVLGLGNPGAKYAHTRHNIGWLVLDALAGRWKAAPGDSTIGYRCRTAAFRGRNVVLMQPLTYMNLSGDALAAWRERHGLDLSELLVVCDDVYLPLGALRLRVRGTSGGHRGLESLEAAIGSPDYQRLRLGVGDAGGAERLREHVLEEFDPSQQERLRRTVDLAADAVECWLAEGPLATMNRFNRRAIEEESPS
jgi:PTH1 family peptidyl-tRNA hydrolase